MDPVGILQGIDLLIGLVGRVEAIAGIIKKAQSEGRDVTAAELAQLAGFDDEARKMLAAAIEKAKSEGR